LEPQQLVDGTALRCAREAAGLTLEHVMAETNVRLDYLLALEEERFQDLPSAPVYVRGYLTNYLTAIGLMSERVVYEYMNRHLKWQAKRMK
jgi:cytoskeletal protein RodZ